MLSTFQPTKALLEVNKIDTNTGFTILQEEQLYLPKTYNYSLHIIDIQQIDDLIKELTISIHELPTNTRELLITETEKLGDKLLTLHNGHHSIRKRGLFNFLGSINKWMTGTMDDEDRQLVNQHLEVIDTNNHNLIINRNKQIQINTNFNTSIQTLLKTIQNDRKLIKEFITNETDRNRVTLTTFDIRLRIQEVDKLINEIQDNIILSNLNVIHPSLLTHEEILNYKIDANKIKNLKVGFSKTTNNKLIFLVKIPFKMTPINRKLIIPLANVNNCNIISNPVTKLF